MILSDADYTSLIYFKFCSKLPLSLHLYTGNLHLELSLLLSVVAVVVEVKVMKN